MPEPVGAERIRELLCIAGSRVPAGSRLLLVGGGAMALLGNPRTTIDFDFIGDDVAPDALTVLILKTAEELKIVADAVPLDKFIPLPEGGVEREVPVGTFGNLEVRVADPYGIALSKLDRGFDTDLDDIAFLASHGFIQLDVLQQFVRKSEQRAAEFDLHPAEMMARIRIVQTRIG